MTLSNAFSPVNNGAGHYRKTSKIQGSKTPPPSSLRLNAEERACLTKEARGVPLGTYIKAKLLGDAAPIRLRGSGVSVEEKAALAKALALLGQSRMANNLNQLAHLAHIGALPLTPETEQDLADAIASIQESHHHQRLAWKDAAEMRITRQRAEAASAAQLESMRNANPSGALGDSCLNDPRNLEQSGLL